MRSHRAWKRVGLLLALVACAAVASAQPAPTAASPPPTFKSLGQPWTLKPYAAGSFTWNREDGTDRPGGVGIVGVYKDLVFPPMSPFGLSAEGYLGAIGSAGSESGGWDGGARLLATSRLFFLNFGLDWNARTEKVDFILAFTPYFRRGGLFGTGGNFRLEWIPGRGNSFNFGFQIPLERHMGKTRPRERDVRLPEPPKAARPVPGPTKVDPAQVSELRGAGNFLVGNANFFNDEDDTSDLKAMEKFRARAQRAKKRFLEVDALHPEGRSHALETRHYHEAFDALFASAVGADEGRAVADRAREILLDEVLLPYDRLIGRFKKPDTLAGLSAQGRLAFGRALDGRPGLDAPRRDAALAAYDEVAGFLDSARQAVKEYLQGDERKVWMPLDLALRPEQHDSQEEIDGIVARALARPFTRGNAIFPTNASRFQIELLRSIHEARDYHVLWVHDFAGMHGGAPDPVAHAVSTKGYLKALADRVREYDTTGRLPAFFLFQTSFFYAGGSYLYLDLLEDPLGCDLKLGKGHETMEAEVRAAQEDLRQAVAASKRLQGEARSKGDRWLRGVVKVHVSVTHPADLSFRSARVVNVLPFAPDMLALDHRKLFFFDVAEEDPGRGHALFSGTGVGSEYAGPTWDDRGLLVSGPAVLQLKVEARRLLRAQGFAESEIPEPLRERPLPSDYDALVDARVAAGRTARALNVHNEVGFGRKEATLVQAVLYTLAPPDTVIVVPDSLWESPFWAGQLAGAAVRGCHVFIVAPSFDNAPSTQTFVLARTREVFARLVEVRRILADEIAASGGHLRIGLYTRAARSGDTLSKIREAAEGLRKYPFLQDEFPMPAGAVELLEQVAAELEAKGYTPKFIAPGTHEGRPKMHRKMQIFATRRALRTLTDLPEAVESIRRDLTGRARATADPASLLQQEDPLELSRPVLEALSKAPPPGTENAVYYLTVGSKNQNPRSAFLDGETSLVVAGPWALYGYSDFIFLLADTTWVETQDELTKLLPVEAERARAFARKIRMVL